jgi:hypothetical protein
VAVVDAKKVEDALKLLFTMPRRAVNTLVIVLGVFLGLAGLIAFGFWLVRPDVTVQVTLKRSTLTDNQREFVDNASHYISENISNGPDQAIRERSDADEDRSHLDSLRRQKSLPKEMYESVGLLECRIQQSDREYKAALEREAAWKERLGYGSSYSPFVSALVAQSTEKWTKHDFDTLTLLVTNTTSRPISGIRIKLIGTSNIWRVTLSSDVMNKNETEAWASKNDYAEERNSVILLPEIPAKKSFRVEVQGDVSDADVGRFEVSALS